MSPAPRVVDTSAWIKWLVGSPLRERLAREIPKRAQCIVLTIVQLELAKWLVREVGEEAADQMIAYTQRCVVVSLDTRIALAAAGLHRQHKLASADAVVYATAREAGAEPLTCVTHFDKLPGGRTGREDGLTGGSDQGGADKLRAFAPTPMPSPLGSPHSLATQMPPCMFSSSAACTSASRRSTKICRRGASSGMTRQGSSPGFQRHGRSTTRRAAGDPRRRDGWSKVGAGGTAYAGPPPTWGRHLSLAPTLPWIGPDLRVADAVARGTFGRDRSDGAQGAGYPEREDRPFRRHGCAE